MVKPKRLRRQLAIPLAAVFLLLWLGTMALLIGSTRDQLDTTISLRYQTARDSDLADQWNNYQNNLENGLGSEAEHIAVDNLSGAALALTDIDEGGMAFLVRDGAGTEFRSQLAWGYGHETGVDTGQRRYLRFDGGLDDAGQLALARWLAEHRVQDWAYTLYPADSWYAQEMISSGGDTRNCDGTYARITGNELPGYGLDVQKLELIHPDGTAETVVETATAGDSPIVLELQYIRLSSVLLPSWGSNGDGPVDMEKRLANFREAQAILDREAAGEERSVLTSGGRLTGSQSGDRSEMRMVAGQCNTLAAALREEWGLCLGTFLLTAAAALLLARFLSGRITQPVEALCQETAAGHCREDGPVTELNTLAAAFNTARDQLAGQLRRERDFTRAAAHELKTPLAVLRTHAEALLEDIDPQKRRQYLETMLDECDRMADLVGRMLELSRLESGAGLRRETVRLDTLVREVVEPLELQASQKALSLDLRLEEVSCSGDPERLREIAGNLISNALRHCAPGGTVRIVLTSGDGRVTFSVSNDGDPIPEKDLPRLWEPFFRGDRSRNRESGGTGLGLAIVRAAAAAHGGSCSAENLPDGVRFSVSLPEYPPAG